MATSAEVAPRIALRSIAGRWWWLASGAAIAVLPVLLSLPFISEPLGRDQGVYFTVVQSGSLPYGEVFDHKPPLIYGWYALGTFLNGGEAAVQAVNLLAALQLSAAALGVTWTGWLLGGRKLGLVAGTLMALMASNRYLQFDANTEVFMLPPLTFSLACCIFGLERKQTRWFCLSGALCGVAIMTKTVAGFNLVALVAALWWGAATGQAAWRDVRRWSMALIGGAAVAVVLAAMPFIVSGTFGDFWHANVTYNLEYNAQVSIFAKLFRFSQVDGGTVLGALPIWGLAIIGAFLACRSLPGVPVAVLLASWLGAFAGAASSGYQFPHYFVTMTPFAALLAGMALLEITRDWRIRRRRLHAEVLLLLLTMPMLMALLPLYALDVDEAYKIAHHGGVDPSRAIADEEVARYVRAVTTPHDRVYQVGREAQIYVLSDRTPAARYIWMPAFKVEPATFETTMRELRSRRPALIIDTSIVDAAELDQDGVFGYRDELTTRQRTELEQLLSEGYEFDRQIGHAKIYRLRQGPG